MGQKGVLEYVIPGWDYLFWIACIYSHFRNVYWSGGSAALFFYHHSFYDPAVINIQPA